MSRLAFCTLLLALATAGCGDTTVTPTPEVQPITDTYEGTLQPNGAERFSFVTAVSGVTTATIASITPADAIIGLGLGSYTASTNTCQVLLSNDKATLYTILQGQSDRAGNLCVRVYDATGLLTAPVSYKIQVVHN